MMGWNPEEGFRREGEHRRGCLAEDDEDGIVFVITTKPPYVFNRRRNGHRKGHTMWWQFTCNDPDCDAILLVRWDKLARFINRAERSITP